MKELIFEIFEFLRLLNPVALVYDCFEFNKYYSLMSNILKEDFVTSSLKNFKSDVLRVDLLNRVYTIVNIPSEFVGRDTVEKTWLIETYRRLDDLLVTLRLSDVLKPFSYKVKGYDSYLIILSPYSFNINWKYMIVHFIGLVITFIGLFFLIHKLFF